MSCECSVIDEAVVRSISNLIFFGFLFEEYLLMCRLVWEILELWVLGDVSCAGGQALVAVKLSDEFGDQCVLLEAMAELGKLFAACLPMTRSNLLYMI